MKGFFKSSLVVALALFTKNMLSNAAPVPGAGIGVQGLGREVEYSYQRDFERIEGHGQGSTAGWEVNERRQLAELFGPVLAALDPLAQGIDQGVTAGAGNINAAVRDAGEAVNQAAQGVGDAAQGVAQGVGETVAEAPGAADRTIHNVEVHGGIAGDVVDTVFGAPSDR